MQVSINRLYSINRCNTHRPVYCNFAAGDVYAVSPTVDQGRMIPINLFRMFCPSPSVPFPFPLFPYTLSFPLLKYGLNIYFFWGGGCEIPQQGERHLQPPDTIPGL